MATRFRKTIKLAPGVKLNVGKKGASVSVGGRGAHVTLHPKHTTTSTSIPGTGIGWSERRRHSGSGNVWIVLAAVLAGLLFWFYFG